MKLTTLGMTLGVALGIAGLSGCATKTYVNDRTDSVSRAADAKIGEVEKQVEATQSDITTLKQSTTALEGKVAELSGTARDALQRAQEAGKLAKGKFLYEVTLTDESVRFPVNQAELSDTAKARLDELAKRLERENANVYIEIQGFTDSTGSAFYNLQLGEARAEAVRRYLSLHNGVPLNRMSTISYGPEKPIAENSTPAGRAQNRRVALVVLS